MACNEKKNRRKSAPLHTDSTAYLWVRKSGGGGKNDTLETPPFVVNCRSESWKAGKAKVGLGPHKGNTARLKTARNCFLVGVGVVFWGGWGLGCGGLGVVWFCGGGKNLGGGGGGWGRGETFEIKSGGKLCAHRCYRCQG